MGKGDQKVQNSSYKTNKTWGFNVQQGPATLELPTGTCPWLVRHRAAQQEVSGG